MVGSSIYGPILRHAAVAELRWTSGATTWLYLVADDAPGVDSDADEAVNLATPSPSMGNPDRRLVTVFERHRRTRTSAYETGHVFDLLDLYVLPRLSDADLGQPGSATDPLRQSAWSSSPSPAQWKLGCSSQVRLHPRHGDDDDDPELDAVALLQRSAVVRTG